MPYITETEYSEITKKLEERESLLLAMGTINSMIVGEDLARDTTAAIKKISFDALRPIKTGIRSDEYKIVAEKAYLYVKQYFGEV